MPNAGATYRLGVDIGGTFTDFALFDEAGGTLAIHKQLTTPLDPSQAVIDGVQTLLARTGVRLDALAAVVHGTTLVTNAIIERRGAVTGMLTTAGFLDIVDMRQEKRYDVFDLRIGFPEPIVPRTLRREVPERVRYDGEVMHAVDLDAAEQGVRELVEAYNIEALAIAFLHAYANPSHELAVRERVEKMFPGLAVTTSAEVFGGRREFERFTSACLNAFTQPMFSRYIERLEAGLASIGFAGQFYVMSSSGGTLAPATAKRLPVRVVESGPAAGVQMSVFHGQALALDDLLSFDMGGTTAKGALIRASAAMKVYELEVARQHDFKAGSGLPLRTPVIDMIEIGAGGGSIASLDARGTIKVGPRSAGAEPGPACYGHGGTTATLTDANLALGYLDPDYFLGGAMRLDKAAAESAIRNDIATPLDVSLERAAYGIHDIISEDVARAFRIHASERGFDYRRSSMVAFGGSGPVHALSVARKLRIPRVIFPVAAGVMSALGLLASPLAFEVARTYESFVDDLDVTTFTQRFADLAKDASEPLYAAGLNDSEIRIVYHLDMRYHGQGHEISVTLPASASLDAAFCQLQSLFEQRYASLFAFTTLPSPLVITNWKVEAFGPTPGLRAGYQLNLAEAVSTPVERRSRKAWFGNTHGWCDALIYDRYSLSSGSAVSGPAFIEERESTVVMGPGEHVRVDDFGNLIAELHSSAPA
jgi:N-methylhydantoinase A